MHARLGDGVLRVGGLALLLAMVLPAVEGKPGEIGVGLVVPDPLGVSVNWFVWDRQSLEFAGGFDGTDTDEVVLRASYLYHFTELFSLRGDKLPFYVGAGGRVVFDDDGDDGLGIRAPVGVAWWPDNKPFDVFLELAPVYEIEPDDGFTLTIAAGARWYP